MFDKKCNITILKFCLYICVSIHCAGSNFSTHKLIELTPIQNNKLKNMLEELRPRYKLTTYLINPLNVNTCYLFIEDVFVEEIKYYTVFLNDDNSLKHVKDTILCSNYLINKKFQDCFNKFCNFQTEIDKFSPLIILFHVVKFNNILKQILLNFFNAIRNVNKKIKIKYNNQINDS